MKPLDLEKGRIDLTHGSGGRAMAQLVQEIFVKAFDNEWLRQSNDQASFSVKEGKMVMATDGHVVSPLFFPGGDIGSLCIHGTLNDVAMSGARPLYLSASFIIEEGFLLSDLVKIANSMAQSARDAGVAIVAGDTKVVEQGKADGVFIATTGIGMVPEGVAISGEKAMPGDRIILSGTIGDHGIAVLSKRENLNFDADILSDTAALHGLVEKMVEAAPGIHCLRDPTRGGLATTLNELARQSGVGMRIVESRIPVKRAVAAACELLGIDPLYVASEGKLVAICQEKDADSLLSVMKSHPLGQDAAIIGEVVEDRHGFVQMETAFGGMRMVDWLTGEPLPRIC